jgi:hypothetical protein
MNARDEINMIT